MSIGQVYQLDIQKVSNGVYWTNTYHVLAADIDAAGDLAVQIANLEATQLFDYTIINAVRASSAVKGDKVFISKAVDIVGLRPASPDNNPLPLFNRFLVIFSPGAGYHGKKFLAQIAEQDQDNGGLTVAARNRINTQFATPLQELSALCSPEGNPYVEIVASPRVGMRQLRRARKRKTPVI